MTALSFFFSARLRTSLSIFTSVDVAIQAGIFRSVIFMRLWCTVDRTVRAVIAPAYTPQRATCMGLHVACRSQTQLVVLVNSGLDSWDAARRGASALSLLRRRAATCAKASAARGRVRAAAQARCWREASADGTRFH